jgi:hypothetical protein
LAAVGCQSDTPGLNLSNGTWNSQSLYPPPNLVRLERSDLFGRPINAGQTSGPMTVQQVLADPVSGAPQYVAATSATEPSSYLILPYSALHVGPGQITVDTTPRTLSELPHMTSVELEQRYRTAVVVPAPPASPVVSALPGASPVVSGLPPAAPVLPNQTLLLVRRGSVVGMPAYDALGQQVGQVDAVAATPGTGEVRYAIITGPPIGVGSYITVPAASTQLVGGRVVVNSTLAALTQLPHYRSEELPPSLGALWSN